MQTTQNNLQKCFIIVADLSLKQRVSVLLLFCQFSVDSALDDTVSAGTRPEHCRSSQSRMAMDGKQVDANGLSRWMQAQRHDKRDTLYLKYVQVSWLRNALMASDSALKASSIHCAGEYQNGSLDARVNSASSRTKADATLLSTQNSGMCYRSLWIRQIAFVSRITRQIFPGF